MADYEEEFIDSMVVVEVRDGWTTIIVEVLKRYQHVCAFRMALKDLYANRVTS